MSSWANRKVFLKRDISKIPEALRPQIIPRAERSEVIISETFQAIKPRNEIITPDTYTNTNKSNKMPEHFRSREIITKKIDHVPHITASELKFKEKLYVFVILRHLRTVKDNDLWISSYNSIRKFYTNKIVIIDDNSSINTVNGKLFNTEIIYSEFPGAGELLPYYYFAKHKWADNMIFLHDSMFLNRPFKDQELEGDAKFHWYFESNGFDDSHKIQRYFSLLNSGNELTEFTSKPENKWKGCFGAAAIINRELVQYIEEKYHIFTQLCFIIKTRKDREAFERLLGIILFYEEGVSMTSYSNFGDILRYPDAFNSENNNIETAGHIVHSRGYDTAILKVWRGR
jgi:hypothetical protein